MSRENRNFGIELEIGTTYSDSKLKKLIKENSKYKQLTLDHYANWHIDKEPSIKFETPDIIGKEIVSPILTINQKSNEIKNIFEKVISNECYVNYSCGLHVHVEVLEHTEMDIKSIVVYMKYIEPFLFKSLPNTRYLGDFCQPFPDLLVDMITSAEDYIGLFKNYYSYFIRDAEKRKNMDEELEKLRKLKYGVHNSRNLALNIHSIWYRGTLEFRYFPSTLSFDEAFTYINLCLSIIENLKNTHYKDVLKFCKAYADDYKALLEFIKLDDIYVKRMIDLYEKNKDAVDICEITLYKH